MDLANDRVDSDTEMKIDVVINNMFQQALSDVSEGIHFEDFMRIVEACGSTLESHKLTLNFDPKYSELRNTYTTL